MKGFYLRHFSIVIALSVGGWISLWLPAYHPPVDPYDYAASEEKYGYIRYVLLMFFMTGFCLAPIIIGVLFFCLVNVHPRGKVERTVLTLVYFPMFLFASASFYENALEVGVTLYSLPATLIYLTLVIYLTYGFPSRANN